MIVSRSVRSYVLRSGNITSSQRQAMATLFERYGLRVEAGPADCQNAILEIGFGMGASLLQMAKDNPLQSYIGVDVHAPGVGALLRGIQAQGCQNLRIYHDDVMTVLHVAIPDAALQGVLIFFPDPWPKRKQMKRRLIQPDFIALLAKKIKPQGFLHIATDCEDYAAHIQKIMQQQSLFQKTEHIPSRPVTKYEMRGKRLGHTVWEGMFVCAPMVCPSNAL